MKVVGYRKITVAELVVVPWKNGGGGDHGNRCGTRTGERPGLVVADFGGRGRRDRSVLGLSRY